MTRLPLLGTTFITRLATDPSLAKFFTRLKRHVEAETAAARGRLSGQRARRSVAVPWARHETGAKGLDIVDAQWNTSAQHLVETLNKLNVPPAQPTAVLGAISALKRDFVEQ